MAKNRIKAIRLRQQLSAEALGARVGLTQGQISKIENGQRGLSMSVAERIAIALQAEVQDILGLSDAVERDRPLSRHFAEDAEPYRGSPDDLFEIELRNRQSVDPWRIKSNVLDRAGIKSGDIVFVDISAAAVANLKPLQAVIAQVYDPHILVKATTVLRQFVPPSLLITNSTGPNQTTLDLDRDDVSIKGVVVNNVSDQGD